MRQNMLSRCLAVSAIAGAGIVGQAHADIIIGNLTAAPSSSTVFGTGSSSIFKACGFTMGADSYDLASATLALDMGLTGGGNPVISIWDGAAAPATELFVLANPPGLSTATGAFDHVFTAPPGSVLSAGQTYWIHVRSDPQLGIAFNWLSTSNANPPTGAGATFVTYNFNGGSSTFYNRFQLDGSISGGGCDPDLTTGAVAGQPGYGVPNGVLNNDDFFYYLAIFSTGC
jgi:hypothetical protein